MVRRTPVLVPSEFTVLIPAEIEERLDQCRDSVGEAMRARLKTVAASAGKNPALTPAGPPQRFYVAENMRIDYQIDNEKQTVSVLGLRTHN
jgi:hypothetical protein